VSHEGLAQRIEANDALGLDGREQVAWAQPSAGRRRAGCPSAPSSSMVSSGPPELPGLMLASVWMKSA
jgi:hypothetical protein